MLKLRFSLLTVSSLPLLWFYYCLISSLQYVSRGFVCCNHTIALNKRKYSFSATKHLLQSLWLHFFLASSPVLLPRTDCKRFCVLERLEFKDTIISYTLTPTFGVARQKLYSVPPSDQFPLCCLPISFSG